ncbi:peptidase family M48-domain-containing protein [Umbelopsis sp. AD052]|nr:peptidase family M48-domain-containing protein [Umbelopsis sp. AD052]
MSSIKDSLTAEAVQDRVNELLLSSGITYKEYVLGFAFAVYGLETYLSWRQYRKYLEPKRPSNLADIVSEEDFAKAQAYGADKSRFDFIATAYGQVQTVAMIVYDGLPLLWDYSGSLMYKFGGLGPEYEITQSLVFFCVYAVISTVLSLPVSLYSTFVVEERHGFNKQSLSLFVTDLLKGHAIGAVIGLPLVAAFLWIIQSAGKNFFFYVWIFMVVFQMIMITLYPTVIQPLFNKLTPLEDGELKSDIEALASRIDFPLKKLFVIDGSKRSSHSNAYFFGFGKNKRIVLFDTLLEHSTIEEVCAVLAHELGHWSMNHTLKILIVTQLHLLALFWLFSLFISNTALYQSFGFSTKPILIGFILFQYIYAPVENVINFLMHVYSRKNEYEADAFALKLGYAESLRSSLIKLNVKNLGNFNPDPLYSAWNKSHPSLVERLAALGVKPTSNTPVAVAEKDDKKSQ